MSRHRSQRVGDELRRLLADLIGREMKDPRIPAMTSVTAVDLSNDLSVAECWISVLGSEGQQEEAIKALSSAAGFLRSELARRISLRQAPELRFRLDRSIERGMELTRKIDEAMGRHPKPTPNDPEEAEA